MDPSSVEYFSMGAKHFEGRKRKQHNSISYKAREDFFNWTGVGTDGKLL
jgi:hypothetical protein